MPSAARGAVRAEADAYWFNRSLDQADIPPQGNTRSVSEPRRSSTDRFQFGNFQFQTFIVPDYPDDRVTPGMVLAPNRAPGAVRNAPIAYSITTSFVVQSEPQAAHVVIPQRAPGQLRAGVTAYFTPQKAPLFDRPALAPNLPVKADGPRRAPNAAYFKEAKEIVTALPPTVAYMPNKAPGFVRAPRTAYWNNQFRVQPDEITVASYGKLQPDSARGPKRAQNTAYVTPQRLLERPGPQVNVLETIVRGPRRSQYRIDTRTPVADRPMVPSLSQPRTQPKLPIGTYRITTSFLLPEEPRGVVVGGLQLTPRRFPGAVFTITTKAIDAETPRGRQESTIPQKPRRAGSSAYGISVGYVYHEMPPGKRLLPEKAPGPQRAADGYFRINTGPLRIDLPFGAQVVAVPRAPADRTASKLPSALSKHATPETAVTTDGTPRGMQEWTIPRISKRASPFAYLVSASTIYEPRVPGTQVLPSRALGPKRAASYDIPRTVVTQINLPTGTQLFASPQIPLVRTALKLPIATAIPFDSLPPAGRQVLSQPQTIAKAPQVAFQVITRYVPEINPFGKQLLPERAPGSPRAATTAYTVSPFRAGEESPPLGQSLVLPVQPQRAANTAYWQNSTFIVTSEVIDPHAIAGCPELPRTDTGDNILPRMDDARTTE